MDGFDSVATGREYPPSTLPTLPFVQSQPASIPSRKTSYIATFYLFRPRDAPRQVPIFNVPYHKGYVSHLFNFFKGLIHGPQSSNLTLAFALNDYGCLGTVRSRWIEWGRGMVAGRGVGFTLASVSGMLWCSLHTVRCAYFAPFVLVE